MHIQTIFRHHSFSSRDSSASLSDHEEDDAITPVDGEYDQEKPRQEAHEMHVETQVPCSSSSPDTPLDDAHLWRRMLALQRQYHCYNSARMSAALEDEAVEAVVPPRACLDLLNDSMATSWPCDEARDEVAALLVLVPDRSRSRAGSYGEIAAATHTQASTNSARASVEPTSTTTTPTGNRSRRQQERMQRRRVWRKRHDE